MADKPAMGSDVIFGTVIILVAMFMQTFIFVIPIYRAVQRIESRCTQGK